MDGDLSFCLTSSETGPFTGACCVVDTDCYCRNTTAEECIGEYDTWHSGMTCIQITCACQSWACCLPGGICERLPNFVCDDEGGTWYRFYVCSTFDPYYDPAAFGGVGNLLPASLCEPPESSVCPITCETPAAFAREIAGGDLYISWDRGAGDQRVCH